MSFSAVLVMSRLLKSDAKERQWVLIKSFNHLLFYTENPKVSCYKYSGFFFFIQQCKYILDLQTLESESGIKTNPGQKCVQ